MTESELSEIEARATKFPGISSLTSQSTTAQACVDRATLLAEVRRLRFALTEIQSEMQHSEDSMASCQFTIVVAREALK